MNYVISPRAPGSALNLSPDRAALLVGPSVQMQCLSSISKLASVIPVTDGRDSSM